MTSGWSNVAFRTLFLEPTRNGVSVRSDDRTSGTQMINMGELFAYRRIPSLDLAVVPLSTGELERSLVEPYDLLFARRSLKWEGAGKCSIVLPASEPRTFESSIVRVRLDPTKADPRFYFYWFNTEVGRRRMGTIVEQVAVAGIRGSDLSHLLVPLPPTGEQERIVASLWAIDERILANQRLCSSIQQLLRARFSKLLLEHAAEGELHPISDLVEAVREKPESRSAKMAYIGLEHMPQFNIVLGDWGMASDSKTANRAFRRGDILFGRIRPYLGKVGIALTDGVAAQSIEVLRVRDPGSAEFALLSITSAEVINYADAISTGTTMPQVPWDGMEEYEVVVPPRPAISEFGRFAEPLIRRMQLAALEARKLALLRDAMATGLFRARSQPHPTPSVEAVK